MDLAHLEKVGKREAEDAIETEVVSSKKLKVEENVGEVKIDTIEVEKKVDEQCIEIKASGEDVHVVPVLEDKINALEEDSGEAKKKPVVASKEGHIAAAFQIDEPNNDADSCFQDATSLDEDVPVAIKVPASLSKEDPATPPKKKDESSQDAEVSSQDAAFLDEDVTAANLSPPPLSTEKSSVSIQKKDDSRIHEFDSHVINNDDNVDTAKEDPPGPTEKDTVVDETNEELESDDEISRSDDDPQTPTTPSEQTSGSKTLFVGNLPFSVWQEDVEDFFKAAGEVVNIRFAMNSDETFKGYGYVEFASAEAAEKALRELNGKELLCRRVRLDYVKERGSFTRYTGCQETEAFHKGGKAQGQTVFVRGFSKSDCQDEIRKSLEEHFSSCGEVSRVSVPKDQDGCARGIAYIEFKDGGAFIRALALNGSEFREGILSVIEAKPRGDSHDSAGSGRCYGRNGWRYGGNDFGGRSGYSNFGERSGGWDFRARSGIRNTGDWGASSGRGVLGGSIGTGASHNSSERGVWGHSNERAASRESSERGVWGHSNERGASRNFSERGVWGHSNERGASCNFRERGVRGHSNERGASRDSSGRGDWGASSGRGGWGNSNGRGGWGDSNGRGASHDSSGRDVWGDSNGRGASRDSNGRGVWGNSNGRGDWDGRGDWGNSRGRSDWGNSNRRVDLGASSGRGIWGNANGSGAWGNSSGGGAWCDSNGRVDWGNSNGRGTLHDSSGRGVWGDSNRRGASHDSSGRSVRWDFSGRGILGKLGERNNAGGTGIWFGGGGRGQGALIEPSIAAREAENNTTFNNEGEVDDHIN